MEKVSKHTEAKQKFNDTISSKRAPPIRVLNLSIFISIFSISKRYSSEVIKASSCVLFKKSEKGISPIFNILLSLSS